MPGPTDDTRTAITIPLAHVLLALCLCEWSCSDGGSTPSGPAVSGEPSSSTGSPSNDSGLSAVESAPVTSAANLAPQEIAAGATLFVSPDSSAVHQMVLVSEGPFQMGSETGYPAESPVHVVTLGAFFIDVYEVTVAQYRACFEAGFCSEPAEADRCEWTEGGPDNHPINCVYWQQAFDYCSWAGLRMPTEAEWEKAARGTDGRTYPWGEEEIDRDRANYKGTNTAKPVGSYPEGVSPYGVYDMSGNVWEWVGDWWDENYYSTSPPDNPTGPDGGEFKVLRSGSWCFLEFSQRSARREPYDPQVTDMDIGFRCARDI